MPQMDTFVEFHTYMCDVRIQIAIETIERTLNEHEHQQQHMLCRCLGIIQFDLFLDSLSRHNQPFKIDIHIKWVSTTSPIIHFHFLVR